MPSPFLCTSASAYDSLPRHTTAQRRGTALQRLRQEQSSASSSSEESDQDKVAFPSSNPKPINRKRLSVESLPIWRSPSPMGAAIQASEARRSRKLSLQERLSLTRSRTAGISVDDLPLVSSDADLVRGEQVREIPTPAKAEPVIHLVENDAAQSSSTPPSTDKPGQERKPRRRQSLLQYFMPSKKETQKKARRSSLSIQAKGRIDKATIGHPTNFSHTGHISAASAGNATQIQSNIDTERDLQAELSKNANEGNAEMQINNLPPSPSSPLSSTACDTTPSPTWHDQDRESSDSESVTSHSSTRTKVKRKPVPASRASPDTACQQGEKDRDSTTRHSSEHSDTDVRPMPLSNIREDPREEFETFSFPKDLPLALRNLALDGTEDFKSQILQGRSSNDAAAAASRRWTANLAEIANALKASDASVQQEQSMPGLAQRHARTESSTDEKAAVKLVQQSGGPLKVVN